MPPREVIGDLTPQSLRIQCGILSLEEEGTPKPLRSDQLVDDLDGDSGFSDAWVTFYPKDIGGSEIVRPIVDSPQDIPSGAFYTGPTGVFVV